MQIALIGIGKIANYQMQAITHTPGIKLTDAHDLDFNDPDVFFMLVHVNCDYLKPVAYKCKIAVHIRCVDIGDKSFKLAYTVADRENESVVYAKGESVQVCLNPELGKSAQVSEKFKKVLEKYRV